MLMAQKWLTMLFLIVEVFANSSPFLETFTYFKFIWWKISAKTIVIRYSKVNQKEVLRHYALSPQTSAAITLLYSYVYLIWFIEFHKSDSGGKIWCFLPYPICRIRFFKTLVQTLRLHAFFISNTFISNARLKLAKNQAKNKQNLEPELSLLENYSLFSSTLLSKNNRRYSKKYTKGKWVSFDDVIWLIAMKMTLIMKSRSQKIQYK